VTQSGGHLWCLSRQGTGTTFSIFLPRTSEGGMKTVTAPVEPDHGRGHGTILLVEDDDPVRQIIRTVLEQDGYTVVESRNGAEALGVFTQDPGRINLLITDLVLPGMSGAQIAETINRKRPALGIIVISGYGDREAGMLDGLSAPGMFMQKPIRSETLLRNVQGILRRGK
jgi:two-component system cell cycle sensor histidine kinase/response regulator CckA